MAADPRITLAAGETEARGVATPTLALRARADATAGFITELLLGETFHVADFEGDWAYGQAARDGYVGYAPVSGLGDAMAPTHRVAALSTNLYARPVIKAPAPSWAPMGALLSGAVEGAFLATEYGYAPLLHLAAPDAHVADFVTVAEALIGAPYLWGGGTARGLDCSGLIQIAMIMAGRPCPRDSDQQEAALGVSLPEGAPLQRGDLVFWKGHVGVMRDGATFLHANAHHMAVVSEPFYKARARIGAPTSILRPE